MVQNKKIVVGMALIAGLGGMGASGAALALPEMQVGSHLVPNDAVASAQAVPVDAAGADDSDTGADDDGQSASN